RASVHHGRAAPHSCWARAVDWPARPSFNRGPVQRRAKRALLVLGTASTSTITQWTHRRPTPGITRSTRRALEQIGAVRVGRAATIGRPWLWRLRNSHEDTR